jgi:hypothetical protein
MHTEHYIVALATCRDFLESRCGFSSVIPVLSGLDDDELLLLSRVLHVDVHALRRACDAQLAGACARCVDWPME